MEPTVAQARVINRLAPLPMPGLDLNEPALASLTKEDDEAIARAKCKDTSKDYIGGTNSSMALSHLGAGLARPFTSFRILVSRLPRMYDILPQKLEDS
ncbi:hypothetical protein GUJ93_ZPchr0009g471 [Zizania palustris]|uniref:Uncharacterized protein n=1 Tax=Zizania palustris TaxID=103762 RepID=A0A8J5RP76_ZIZPA|nr:hypothetical protein GUJ93_ZPchr0009g471 [Zizania palustris]